MHKKFQWVSDKAVRELGVTFVHLKRHFAMKLTGIIITTMYRIRDVDSQNLQLLRLTADKREIQDFPKSRQVRTSFVAPQTVVVTPLECQS